MSTKKSKKQVEVLITKSKVKSLIREESGFAMSSDAFDGLNKVVASLCFSAIQRTKANGRKTIRPHDFDLNTVN